MITNEVILARNRTAVTFATNHTSRVGVWVNTIELTTERNVTNAASATSLSQDLVTCLITKELTLVRNLKCDKSFRTFDSLVVYI